MKVNGKMWDFRITAITTILSCIVFSFLLHNFNQRICGLFISMQKDLDKINKINRRILYFMGHMLSISISVNLALRLKLSSIEYGLILGFLIAIVNICFESNIKKYYHKR